MENQQLTIHLLDGLYAVCQLPDVMNLPLMKGFSSLTVTGDEVSLVCHSDDVPTNAIACESGWRVLMIAGILDFILIGILAGISMLLADEGISIFVISTYNTDYILVKETQVTHAMDTLRKSGYIVVV